MESLKYTFPINQVFPSFPLFLSPILSHSSFTPLPIPISSLIHPLTYTHPIPFSIHCQEPSPITHPSPTHSLHQYHTYSQLIHPISFINTSPIIILFIPSLTHSSPSPTITSIHPFTHPLLTHFPSYIFHPYHPLIMLSSNNTHHPFITFPQTHSSPSPTITSSHPSTHPSLTHYFIPIIQFSSNNTHTLTHYSLPSPSHPVTPHPSPSAHSLSRLPPLGG